MRTLLRDTKRGVYYGGEGRWTANHYRALDFELIDRAMRYARKNGLTEGELVFAFDNPRSLTGVPLAKLTASYADESVRRKEGSLL